MSIAALCAMSQGTFGGAIRSLISHVIGPFGRFACMFFLFFFSNVIGLCDRCACMYAFLMSLALDHTGSASKTTHPARCQRGKTTMPYTTMPPSIKTSPLQEASTVCTLHTNHSICDFSH